MINKIRKYFNRYESFLLYILADIVISIETVWFVELLHLIGGDSPSSLLWQGGLGYLLSILVSYYFIKNVIFLFEEESISRFVKFWTVTVIFTVLWQIIFEITYHLEWNDVICYILCYILGKAAIFMFLKFMVFVNKSPYKPGWLILSTIALFLIPTALQGTFTSAYHLLKTADYTVSVEPTHYLYDKEGDYESFDPGWGYGYVVSLKRDWFDEDPSVFNPDLAYTCSFLSDISYMNSNSRNNGISEVLDDIYASLGFDWINTASYSYRSKTIDKYINLLAGESNGATYVVAGKKLNNDRKLIMVSICGSVTIDFIDDLEMGINRDYEIDGHAGFQNAAAQIVQGFMNSTYLVDDNTTVLFTGHSRGGGVANLAAAMMIEKYEEIGIHPTVMAYTLACPNTAGRLTVEERNYDTIFNIINPYDIICYVPFKTMGLTRYGNDIDLGNICNDGVILNYAKSEIKKMFNIEVNVDYSHPEKFKTAIENMEKLYTPDFLDLKIFYRLAKTGNEIIKMGIGDYANSHKLKLYTMLINKGLR